MEKKIRDAVDRSLEELKVVQDKFEAYFDGLSDDASSEGKEIKESAKNALGQINALLTKAMQKAGDQADEAQLQAHLGVMEAREKMESSRVVMDDYIARKSNETKTLLDEAELKRHLAVMEAQDFWEKQGSSMAEEFKQSASKMQSAAENAMKEMQATFESWTSEFTKKK